MDETGGRRKKKRRKERRKARNEEKKGEGRGQSITIITHHVTLCSLSHGIAIGRVLVKSRRAVLNSLDMIPESIRRSSSVVVERRQVARRCGLKEEKETEEKRKT